jgi:hypothetical protein
MYLVSLGPWLIKMCHIEKFRSVVATCLPPLDLLLVVFVTWAVVDVLVKLHADDA